MRMQRVAALPDDHNILPTRPPLRHDVRMLRNVVVIAQDNVAPFELGVLSEVFGIDRGEGGCPVYDFPVCTVPPGRVRTKAGYDIPVEHGLEVAARAALIAIPAAARPDSPTSA